MVVGAHGFSIFCSPFCCYRCVCGAGIRSRTNTTVCVQRAARPTRRSPSRRTRSTAKSMFIRSFVCVGFVKRAFNSVNMVCVVCVS